MNTRTFLREIVLDTETTGLSPEKGDRIVDIGCVELINHVPTGKTYQVYINPQRPMHPDASAISGITDDFLQDKPLFAEIVDDFLDFVGNDTLVIHNAKFDINFLNSELSRLDKPTFALDEAVDTLLMARKKFPGSPASLDALCKRFDVDTSARVTHGALVDCLLLAEVYIHLLGGKQSDLSFTSEQSTDELTNNLQKTNIIKNIRPPRNFEPSPDELLAHGEFIQSLKDALWIK